MSGGSNCWVTCLSLGLPGVSLSSTLIPATPLLLPQRVSTLQPGRPRPPHMLLPGSSPQPSATLFPSPASSSLPSSSPGAALRESHLLSSCVWPRPRPRPLQACAYPLAGFLSRPAPEAFTPANGGESCLSAPSQLGRSRGKSVGCNRKGRSGGLWGGGLGPR